MWEHNSRFPRLPARTAPPTTSWRPAKGPKISTITSLPVSAFGWQLETSEQRCTLWATLPTFDDVGSDTWDKTLKRE
ncbi:hypothetical protein LMH87_000388 [Akanthomyces muscarius]|uniref:Uncharacterized protein n=1 Tax=Akanthomyces muscarius TaxID=2231603 RepID=A0A9W8QFC4_AKAMU|nr:hypothetical protein LMH87_000388 [Akanthomyces muscarius]KAJ4155124.1 hypothetical protein LMH87_000388 [Akanthomyces muscarius]